MFNLIRRISYGVIPRLDRPWEDDATSNAPRPRRKRRLSSTEPEPNHESEEEQARKKKARGESTSSDLAESNRETPLPLPEAETREVKEVTKGVKEVDLDADADADASLTQPQDEGVQVKRDGEEEKVEVVPESVPLPEEESGELDEDEETGESIASSPRSVHEGEVKEVDVYESTEVEEAGGLITDIDEKARESAEGTAPETALEQVRGTE